MELRSEDRDRKNVYLKIGYNYNFFDVEARSDKIGMVVSFDNFRAVLWVNDEMKSVNRKFIKNHHMDRNGNR